MSADSDPSDTASLQVIALVVIKTFSIVLLVTISILLGLAPLKIKRLQRSPQAIGYINSFSAGLFLGMGLLHLLVASLKDYHDYKALTSNEDSFYPIPVFVAIASFAFVLFLEKVAFSAHEFIHPFGITKEEEMHIHRLSDDAERGITQPMMVYHQSSICYDSDEHEENFKEIIDLKKKLAKRTRGLQGLQKMNTFSHIKQSLTLGVGATTTKKQVLHSDKPQLQALSERLIDEQPLILEQEVESEGKSNVIPSLDLEIAPKKDGNDRQIVVSPSHHHEGGHDHEHIIGPFAILVALSIHGALEGIAVGIQNTAMGTINLVIAVLLHKWAEAFTLGVALYKAELPVKKIVTQIIIFSLAGPIGIIIGWILSQSSLFISSIFKAVPAGTFLYIAATEIIVEEFSVSTKTFRKFLLFIAGIVMMGLLLLIDRD